ncbi:hypothetical protein ADK96_37360 [Streptomyces sp. IGB124]|nr:hypothetical protein ADK96_37360 [Streptomyces sp. IGB124]
MEIHEMTLSESTGYAPAVVSAVPALGRVMRPSRRGAGRRKSPGADAAEDLGGDIVSARTLGACTAALTGAATVVVPGAASTGPVGERGPW